VRAVRQCLEQMLCYNPHLRNRPHYPENCVVFLRFNRIDLNAVNDGGGRGFRVFTSFYDFDDPDAA